MKKQSAKRYVLNEDAIDGSTDRHKSSRAACTLLQIGLECRCNLLLSNAMEFYECHETRTLPICKGQSYHSTT